LLHNTLAAAKKKFVALGQLPKHDAALWVPKNSENKNHLVFRPVDWHELKKCKTKAFAWMGAAAIHFLELEQHGGEQGAQNGGEILLGLASGSYDKATAAGAEGGKNIAGHDEAATSSYQTEQPNFCVSCRKWGHIEEFCPDIYLEEQQPLYCDLCDKEGHWEETCWILHLEFKEQYLREQREKMKKARCHNYGKTGHMRRFCHLLHK
jgi:hypothetical protein